MFHVTSMRTRDSIARFGLDWSRMGPAPGVAGAGAPEVEGIFVCPDESDVDFFVHLNTSGAPVDVWAIDGVDPRELIEADNGFAFLPRRVAPEDLTLVSQALTPTREDHDSAPTAGGAAYQSTLTITLDDGTVRRDWSGPEPDHI